MEENILEGNKYFKWYWSICNRAKDRILESSIYTEKHHIYPKSIYGKNNNLVKLTAKEHYIVHLLLWWGLRTKYGTKDQRTIKMAGAFSMMNMKSNNQQRYNSKEYSFLRISSSESQKYKIISKETRLKLSAAFTGEKHPNYGRHPTEETLKKMRKPKTKKTPFTEEHIRHISESLKGHIVSDETRKKQSDSWKNRMPVSEETKKLLSEKNSGKNNPMYGKKYYDIWVEKYGKEEADNRQQKCAEKKLETRRKNKNEKVSVYDNF